MLLWLIYVLIAIIVIVILLKFLLGVLVIAPLYDTNYYHEITTVITALKPL